MGCIFEFVKDPEPKKSKYVRREERHWEMKQVNRQAKQGEEAGQVCSAIGEN